MFAGMISYPSFAEVVEALGDKVIGGFSRAVVLTQYDLAEYRDRLPGSVAAQSERGLANWIHDQLWKNILAALDGVDGVSFLDKEPYREIFVGLRYRLRVKRHRTDGAVSAYPTQGALEFFTQEEQLTLDGLEEIRLSAGYSWDPDTRQIVAPVLSLRDGHDNLVWFEELPSSGGSTGVVTITPPSQPGPSTPTIEVASDSSDESNGQEAGSP